MVLVHQSSPAESAALFHEIRKTSMQRSPSESCLTAETSSSEDDDESTSILETVSEQPQSITNDERLKRPPTLRRRRSSIRDYDPQSIPIRNRGWKNLPKVTTNLPRPVSSPSLLQTPPKPSHRRVSFENVEFRCFEQCAGDNPAVSIGTPISLDWSFEDMQPISLDDYEAARADRRKPRQLMLNYFQRRTLLGYWYGYSEEDINAAEKAANRVRNQRSVTKALLPASLVEDMLTSAVRKTKRALGKESMEQPLIWKEDVRMTVPEAAPPVVGIQHQVEEEDDDDGEIEI